MRVFTIAERRTRLARRHFLSPENPAASPAAAARSFVGLHATDPATPYLSLWARLRRFTVADLDTELYERRTVVKHLAMRRTLWLVGVEDLPFIQSAASDRVAANELRKLAADAHNAGLEPDGETWVKVARAAVLSHLEKHGPTGARELREALPELAGSHDPAPGKSYGGETPLAPRVLTVLGVHGEIMRGPNEGSWTVSRPRWAATADWLGAPYVPAPADEARAELVRRWLATFGPATVTDVKWWFGHTLTWARHALRDIGAVEVELEGCDAPGYVLPDDLDPEPEPQPWVALLPGLDVTTMGWFDRDWYLDGLRDQVFDRNGNAGPTVWCDGRVVGAWAHDADGRVDVRLCTDIGRAARKLLQRKADDLTEWLNGTRVKPRFPSPLSKGQFTG
ncbi:winged helix DNA-binding domain-containing protein [Mycolicibacterium smegmatis]|uniref:winged helix DNA-binding domain-containing protein n=1 Tax=Mycolicibacterium smegmatis TaxID=1772 RepID=UPI001E585655|nr:winged helix DNA-binding domain-containing protein [Mycolicibacterium smegmatis]UGU32882.1 winged helix DNA-binding domain-containing protein [Mycolicibacterium smegmatis]ULN67766.1 winged helix DNA-binding domain-containing protein [Mycolicibacterium smegmatis]